MTHHGQIEGNGHCLELYENGRLGIAVENRADEERYRLFPGQNQADVYRRVKQDFTSRSLA